MQEETEVLGENLRGHVWIENQIHIRLWPDWESNPGRIVERHGNNCCANPPAHIKSVGISISDYLMSIDILLISFIVYHARSQWLSVHVITTR